MARGACLSAVWAFLGETHEALPAKAHGPILASMVIRIKVMASRNTAVRHLLGMVIRAWHRAVEADVRDTTRKAPRVVDGRSLSTSRRSRTSLYSLV